MSTKEKIAMWALIIVGATAGFIVQGIAGAAVGGAAGLGTLVIVFYADDTLRTHYRSN